MRIHQRWWRRKRIAQQVLWTIYEIRCTKIKCKWKKAAQYSNSRSSNSLEKHALKRFRRTNSSNASFWSWMIQFPRTITHTDNYTKNAHCTLAQSNRNKVRECIFRCDRKHKWSAFCHIEIFPFGLESIVCSLVRICVHLLRCTRRRSKDKTNYALTFIQNKLAEPRLIPREKGNSARLTATAPAKGGEKSAIYMARS